MEWTIDMANNIHWYPGHMKKATIKIEERIKSVDLVIELLDARAPLSSINTDFEKIVGNKNNFRARRGKNKGKTLFKATSPHTIGKEQSQ